MRALCSLSLLLLAGCPRAHDGDADSGAGRDAARPDVASGADTGRAAERGNAFLLLSEPGPGRVLVVRRERDGSETARVEARLEEGVRPAGLVANADGSAALLHSVRVEGRLTRNDTLLLEFASRSVTSVNGILAEAGCAPLTLLSHVEWLPSGQEFLIDCEDRVLRRTLAGATTSTEVAYAGTLPDGRLIGVREGMPVFVDVAGEVGDAIPLDETPRVLLTYTGAGEGFIDLTYLDGDAVGIADVRWRNLEDTERELLIDRRSPYALPSHPSPAGSFFVYQNEGMAPVGAVELWSRAGRVTLPDEAARCGTRTPGVPSVAWSVRGTALLGCAEDVWQIDAAGEARLVSVADLVDATWSPDGEEALLEGEAESVPRWRVLDAATGAVSEVDVPEGTVRVAWAQRAWEPMCLTAVCW